MHPESFTRQQVNIVFLLLSVHLLGISPTNSTKFIQVSPGLSLKRGNTASSSYLLDSFQVFYSAGTMLHECCIPT